MNREFGTTQWGRAWLRLAEPLGTTRPHTALPKARSLARRDRVTEFATDAGKVGAAVLDGAGPRTVMVRFPVWDSAQRETASALLEGLTADLPEHLPNDLHHAGAPVAPSIDELDPACDCQRSEACCVHVLATLVELARRVDEDPRLVLTLRGAGTAIAPAPGHSRIPLARLDPASFYTAAAR